MLFDDAGKKDCVKEMVTDIESAMNRVTSGTLSTTKYPSVRWLYWFVIGCDHDIGFYLAFGWNSPRAFWPGYLCRQMLKRVQFQSQHWQKENPPFQMSSLIVIELIIGYKTTLELSSRIQIILPEIF